VPVPQHRERLRERGFNPALVVGPRGGARGRELRYRDRARACKKYTEQTGLQCGRARRRNVRDALRAAARCPGACGSVDDVITTGATLREAARVLTEPEARR
jgi:predicted amidophosphoribosyltransferase